jgi:hypothetical protein
MNNARSPALRAVCVTGRKNWDDLFQNLDCLFEKREKKP